MTLREIEERIQMLRVEYVERPGKREIIKRQARALEIAKEFLVKHQNQ